MADNNLRDYISDTDTVIYECATQLGFALVTESVVLASQVNGGMLAYSTSAIQGLRVLKWGGFEWRVNIGENILASFIGENAEREAKALWRAILSGMTGTDGSSGSLKTMA